MSTALEHILIVSSEFPPQPGGIGTHAYHLARSFSEKGYKISVITDQRSFSGTEEVAFDAALPFTVYRIARFRFRWVMYIKRLYFLFRHLKVGQTVIASGKFSLWIVAFASLFFNRKYFAVLHGSEVNFSHWLLKDSIRISLRRFKTLIAVSHYTKSLVDHLHPQVAVIPNGISISELEVLTPQPISLKGSPRLLTVGRVSTRKGQLNVIKQLPDLLKAYPDLHYHCVGIPTESHAFIAAAKQLGVDQHVSFHGRVSTAELYSYYCSSTLFVMLSEATTTGDVEGFGIALLEANYFGLPTIGALGCGIEDAISDSKSGRLILPTDTEGLQIAIHDILSHYETYSALAQQWSLQHNWAQLINNYINIIDD